MDMGCRGRCRIGCTLGTGKSLSSCRVALDLGRQFREDLAAQDEQIAALREAAEELGFAIVRLLLPLGEIRQAGGERVIAFALEGDFDPDTLASNTVEIEWPPRSGGASPSESRPRTIDASPHVSDADRAKIAHPNAEELRRP